jgi:NAD(P)-dependent dehydrogenase (short-subunit alcohol dehydrogenase family)
MQNPLDYTGRRVVVTGAASGMGGATAKMAKEQGAEVVAIDINKPDEDYAEYHQVDLRDRKAVEDVVKEINSGGKINNLFYCAGLPGQKFPDFDVIAVNFLSLRYMSELFAETMGSGDAITNVSSGASLAYLGNMGNVMELLAFNNDYEASFEWLKKPRREVPDWYEPYSFSKQCSVVWTLQSGANITMKRGVRVNVTSPGPTDTAMMPTFVENQREGFFDEYPKPIENRNSTPEEQAWPLLFLGSPAASYISGENLFTDGGTCAGMMTGVIDPTPMMADPSELEERRARAREEFGEDG